VAPRSRVLAFGSAAAAVAAGALCLVLINGLTGEALAIGLISGGLGAAVLLAFYEVGLSEDKERAREERRRPRQRPRVSRWPRRPS
jgi:hypothetical protein